MQMKGILSFFIITVLANLNVNRSPLDLPITTKTFAEMLIISPHFLLLIQIYRTFCRILLEVVYLHHPRCYHLTFLHG